MCIRQSYVAMMTFTPAVYTVWEFSTFVRFLENACSCKSNNSMKTSQF